MSTVQIDRLVRNVAMYAPNCPEPTILYALRMTIIDFCQETMWWTKTLDPIDVEEGETEYPLNAGSGVEPVSVLAAWYKDIPLYPMGQASHDKWPWLKIDERAAKPAAYTTVGFETIKLAPKPDRSEKNALVVKVAVMPTMEATAVDGELMSFWTDTLINGALARIYDIPNQPFTNPGAADKRELMYRRDLVRAKIHANKAKTNVSLTVKPRHP